MQRIKQQVLTALTELLEVAHLSRGDLLVVGCSSSEIVGGKIGKNSAPDAADAVVSAILPVIKEKGIYLAAQCCEHLNRSLIVEKEYALAHNLSRVNVVPHAHAGGAFATAVYAAMEEPCAVMNVSAQAGLDIGQTLIGMHLAPVAVPVRTSVSHVGEAVLVTARTRLPYVGGERAKYDESLA